MRVQVTARPTWRLKLNFHFRNHVACQHNLDVHLHNLVSCYQNLTFINEFWSDGLSLVAHFPLVTYLPQCWKKQEINSKCFTPSYQLQIVWGNVTWAHHCLCYKKLQIAHTSESPYDIKGHTHILNIKKKQTPISIRILVWCNRLGLPSAGRCWDGPSPSRRIHNRGLQDMATWMHLCYAAWPQTP